MLRTLGLTLFGPELFFLSLGGAGSWLLCLQLSGDQPRLCGLCDTNVASASSKSPIHLAVAFRLQTSVLTEFLEPSWQATPPPSIGFPPEIDQAGCGQVIRTVRASWRRA